jgi:hypothetical protein
LLDSDIAIATDELVVVQQVTDDLQMRGLVSDLPMRVSYGILKKAGDHY